MESKKIKLYILLLNFLNVMFASIYLEPLLAVHAYVFQIDNNAAIIF